MFSIPAESVKAVAVTAGTVTVKLLAVFVGISSMLPPLAAESLTPMMVPFKLRALSI
jgi:hypothetical protein